MLRPFLVLLLVWATVSSTTYWTKKDQTLDLACPMPEDGEKLQVCSWRNGDKGGFKSSFKESHGNRVSTKENNTDCIIRIERVEEEDEGIWECKVHYQNKDGEAALFKNKIVVDVANVALELSLSMPKDGEKLQVCSWRNGDEGAFKSSFRKSHGDRISVHQDESTCALLFSRVEEEDIGTWQCKMFYLLGGTNVESVKTSTVGPLKTILKEALDNKSEKPSSVDKSSLKSSSIDRLSTNESTLNNNSHKHSSVDKSSMKGSSMNRSSTNNSTLDNNCLKHSSLDTSLMTVTEPFFDFAYSVALSVSAGAAGSTTAEVGVAFGANAEVLVYASYCVGLKADVSLEVDLSLGFYKSLDDILGHYYMLGGGVDITKKKTDETEANVKIIKNAVGGPVGSTVSLGVGVGPDFPIGWEVNFDKCYASEIGRISFSDLYKTVWDAIPSKHFFVKFLTILTKLTHESSDI